MSANETSMLSEGLLTSPEDQHPLPTEGSLASYLSKASDFLVDNQRVISKIDSYWKNRRYVHLELSAMFTSLTGLYSRAFASIWAQFKRHSDFIVPQGTSASDAQTQMAQIYISHWMLDLYLSVRQSVERLTPVALTECFMDRPPRSSNEYDAFLCHLNSVIRPTHIVGVHVDGLFIPRFTDRIDMTAGNPFNILGFTLDLPKLKSIIYAMKDNKVGWKTSTLTNETVGRPVWLFDWFAPSRACAWFPREGNYTNEDVMYAFVIGVACTPKLGQQDLDNWQEIPAGNDPERFDGSRLRRIKPRRDYGDYEVESFHIHNVKFITGLGSIHPEPSSGSTTPAGPSQKRARTSHYESDTSQPGTSLAAAGPSSAMEAEKEFHMVQKTVYLYNARVILDCDDETRLNCLLSLIGNPSAHSIC